MYQEHPTSAKTPSRMARKRMRGQVFVHNKKLTKMRRKTERLKRKSLEQGE